MRIRTIWMLSALVIGLVASPAGADLSKKSPRASLVQVLRGGRQALLLDRSTGEYQVVKIGDAVQGYRVFDIEDDQIVLSSPLTPERFFVLPLVGIVAPGSAAVGGVAAGGAVAGAGDAASPAPAPSPSVSQPAPEPGPGDDPAGMPGEVDQGGELDAAGDAAGPDAPAGGDVLDPYAAPGPATGGLPSVIAPPASRVEPGAGAGAASPSATPSGPASGPVAPVDPAFGDRAGDAAPQPPLADGADAVDDIGLDIDSVSGTAPGAGAEPGARPADKPADKPTVKPADKPGAAPARRGSRDAVVDPAEVRPGGSARAAAPAADDARKVSRRELDAALADFSALTRQVQIEPAEGGGVRILDIEGRSFFAHLGIERGDIIRRVAGHSIDTVDEAAAAYAALTSARDVAVDLERRGAKLRLRYRFTR